MKKRIYIPALAALLICSALILFYYKWNKPHQDIAVETGIKMDATDLFREFSETEKTATAKYNGKVLEITGIVSDISTNQEGKKIVQLQTDDPLFGINCTMEKNINLKQGETVTLKGICSGFTTDVIIIRCYPINN
jgi:hypothetical protein